MADPALWAAVVGLAGFCGWLLRDYIAYLKADAERERLEKNDWKQLAMKGASGLERAVEKVAPVPAP